MSRKATAERAPATLRDHVGLNGANFFLAELGSVIMPFLSAFLRQKHWDYSAIGVTVAISGLGTLLFLIPAGILSDKITRRRLLLSGSALALGACYAALPRVIGQVLAVDLLLFVSGMAAAFFVPLLAALALSLAGHEHFDRTLGVNQSWNHAGNIAASIATLLSVKYFGITAVFYIVGVLSILASLSLRLMNGRHLNPDLTREDSAAGSVRPHPKNSLLGALREHFRNPATITLVASVVLFHIANAPTMATVALYLKSLGSKDDFVAWAIIISQSAMVPVAYLAARLCTAKGRKPVMAFAFLALAVRISLYPFATTPNAVLAIQLINGLDAGIYGVAICLICGDLTFGKGGFNTLLSVMTIALAIGDVVGPLVQGFLTQHYGFKTTFFCFAATAMAGGILFVSKMPETMLDTNKSTDGSHSAA